MCSRNLILCATVLCLFGFIPMLDAEQDWIKISSREEGFSVLIPKSAKLRQTKTMHIYETAFALPQFLFGVVFRQPDVSKGEQKALEEFCEEFLKAAEPRDKRQNLAYKTVFEKNLRVNNFPGKQYRVINGEDIQLYRFLLTQKRYYMMRVSTTTADKSGDGARFLDSLQLFP